MIENAQDAVALTAAHVTLESVLKDVEFAAKKGGRSWCYAWLPDDLRDQLRARGFVIKNLGEAVSVTW